MINDSAGQPTAAFATVGCRLNQAETESIIEEFIGHGWQVVEFGESADLYFINTCTVTGRADRSSRQLIHRARRRNPGATVVAAGCFAQRAAEEIVGTGEVDFVLGVAEKAHPFDYLNGIERPDQPVVHVSGDGALINPAVGTRVSGRSRAFLKVQDGCDHECAYCAVTLVRGLSRSVPPEQVITAFQRIRNAGFEEVVLTGVDISAWGRDIKNRSLDIVDLVEMAADEGLPRIRLSSMEPWELTPSRIKRLASIEPWCEHLHVSLQSADPAVLEKMKRPVDVEKLRETIAGLVQLRPEATIGADLIAGLPGEDEEAFQRTFSDFLDRGPVHYLHVFPFSPRPGTPAERMEGIPMPEVITKRAVILRNEGRKRRRAHLESAIGKTVEILVEENGREGYTRNYMRVSLSGGNVAPRKRRTVRLTDLRYDDDVLLAEVM